MTRDTLIFDWRVRESSFRFKIVSYLVVGLAFAFFFGALRIRVSAPAQTRGDAASVIRFADEPMARSWLLVAEENGPFPGGLELGGTGDALTATGDDRRLQWSDYKAALRPLRDDTERSGEALSAKGVRVFPEREKTTKPEPTLTKKLRQAPILIPYDPVASAWMPESLPDFQMPAGAAAGGGLWRFAVNLRENGSVRDAIALEGGADPARQAMERWLRNVRFKEAEGDRWVGLRMEFVNLPEDGTDTE